MIGAEDQPAAEDESADGEYGTQREVRDGQQGVTYSLEDFVERVEDTQVTQKCKPADHIPGCQCKVAGVGQNTFGELISTLQSCRRQRTGRGHYSRLPADQPILTACSVVDHSIARERKKIEHLSITDRKRSF